MVCFSSTLSCPCFLTFDTDLINLGPDILMFKWKELQIPTGNNCQVSANNGARLQHPSATAHMFTSCTKSHYHKHLIHVYTQYVLIYVMFVQHSFLVSVVSSVIVECCVQAMFMCILCLSNLCLCYTVVAFDHVCFTINKLQCTCIRLQIICDNNIQRKKRKF